MLTHLKNDVNLSLLGVRHSLRMSRHIIHDVNLSSLGVRHSLRDANTSHTWCEYFLTYSWKRHYVTSIHRIHDVNLPLVDVKHHYVLHVLKLSLDGFYGLSSRTQARNLWYWWSRVFNTLKANSAIYERNKRWWGVRRNDLKWL